MLRIETLEIGAATDPAVINLVYGCRKLLLEKFGGRGVDFNMLCASTCNGTRAVITLVPVSMVERDTEDHSMWINPDTGKTTVDFSVPCRTVDFSHGKGNIHCWNDAHRVQALEGHAMMSRLYDFACKPGSRKAIADYLAKLIWAWKEPPVGKAKIPAGTERLTEPPSGEHTFWDAGRKSYVVRKARSSLHREVSFKVISAT